MVAGKSAQKEESREAIVRVRKRNSLQGPSLKCNVIVFPIIRSLMKSELQDTSQL